MKTQLLKIENFKIFLPSDFVFLKSIKALRLAKYDFRLGAFKSRSLFCINNSEDRMKYSDGIEFRIDSGRLLFNNELKSKFILIEYEPYDKKLNGDLDYWTAMEKAKCQSLSYFAKKYLVIKDEKGNTIPLRQHDLEFIEMIERAQKEDGELIIWKGRTRNVYAIKKR